MSPDEIPWANYQTAYGSAAGDHVFGGERWGNIGEQLRALASPDRATAMAASHHLWCCLCHQHAYVSSAAEPALPFILAVLDHADDELAIEIDDILRGFATCSPALRARLVAERPRLARCPTLLAELG